MPAQTGITEMEWKSIVVLSVVEFRVADRSTNLSTETDTQAQYIHRQSRTVRLSLPAHAVTRSPYAATRYGTNAEDLAPWSFYYSPSPAMMTSNSDRP